MCICICICTTIESYINGLNLNLQGLTPEHAHACQLEHAYQGNFHFLNLNK